MAVEKHVRKVVRGTRGKRLLLFLPVYKESTDETTGTTPAINVFGIELRLPRDLLFGTPLNKEKPTKDYLMDHVERMHDIHHYACQHLKVASDTMKAI
jgi:hypothetical protein